MLKECIEVFKKELNSKGERLLLDGYMPSEGTYIIVTEENCNFIIKDENIIDIKYDNKTKEPINSEIELNRVRVLDYNSKLIDMNKALDVKKIIHSNNYLSFFIKKDKFPTKEGEEKKLSLDVIEGYYSNLINPYLKYKSGKPKEIYKSIEDSIGEVNINEVNKIKGWIIENIFDLGKVYSGKNYLKIFFDYPIEDYIRENKRYVIPNIYNKNDYNFKIGDIVYGLPNDNMGLNSKKPYLENRTRKISIPNLVNTEDVLVQRKFFDYLMNFATEGNVNIYIGDKIYARKNGELPPNEFYGDFLRIKKGKELEIIAFDKIVGYKEELAKKVDYKNLLDVNIIINEDEVKFDEYGNKKDIQNLISEVFFSKYLIKNYFTEAKDISLKDSNVKRNLLIAREGIFNWLYKGENNGINKLLDKVSMNLIKSSILLGNTNKANKQFNLRLALKGYFEGGKDMAIIIKEIKDKLRVKINSREDIYIENDDEYCFAIGYLANYFISQSKAAKKPQFLINNFLDTESDDLVRKNLKQLYKKYNYKEEMNTPRIRNLYSMILGYELDSNLNDDMILLGSLSKSLFYENKESEVSVGGDK
ncbi:MAG: type I-B CRISPR-associated protein Cas8b/Csh1 [Clostridium celatum]|nr:type I-B CRISPR-associated protein Cas8b/Csh1 [Clostridium celatum]MDU4980671.1 type I-B CRISPR-associated protein Cas8b/Csh1 [Clostridium celatum]